MSKYGVFSGPYFPAFGLNTERYEVFGLRIWTHFTQCAEMSLSIIIDENMNGREKTISEKNLFDNDVKVL